MTIYRGVGGVSREIKQQYRGVGGVNREIKEQYREVGGVNRKILSSELAFPVLYDIGKENISVAGGFGCYYSFGSNGLFQKNSDHILFGDNLSSGYANMNVSTENLIDVTNFAKLYIDYEVLYNYCTGNENFFGICLLGSKTTELNTATNNKWTGYHGWASSVARTISYIDISSTIGKYYIVGVNSSANYPQEQIYGKIYKIWLS